MRTLRWLWSDSDGQDVAEYALMLTVTAVVTIVALLFLGKNADQVFSRVAASLSQVVGAAS